MSIFMFYSFSLANLLYRPVRKEFPFDMFLAPDTSIMGQSSTDAAGPFVTNFGGCDGRHESMG